MIPQRSGKIINICSLFSYPRRPLVVGLRGHQARPRRLHQGLLRRARRVQHPGQRHRPRLLRHRDHDGDAQRPGDQQARARPHPGGALGRACGPHGRRRLPRQPGIGLRQRPRPGGRRRLPRPLGRGEERERLMAGKYLIGIDGGTQSSKVVIYDLEGNVVCEARRTLLPMEHPEPGYAVHPDDDLWESIVAASREAMTQVPRRPGGHPRRRPLHHPLLQGLPQGRRHAARARHELDGHARLPALDPGRPRARLRDHLVRLHDAPLHRASSATAPPTTSSCSGPSTPTRGSGGPGAVRAVQHAPASCWWSCRCRATSPAT